MAIEDNVNLKRDVEGNGIEIQYVWSDIEELWDEIAAMTLAINEINKLKQRMAVMESELRYINRDHMDMNK